MTGGIVDKPRKFPHGCGPNAPRTNVNFTCLIQRSYSVGTSSAVIEDTEDGNVMKPLSTTITKSHSLHNLLSLNETLGSDKFWRWGRTDSTSGAKMKVSDEFNGKDVAIGRIESLKRERIVGEGSPTTIARLGGALKRSQSTNSCLKRSQTINVSSIREDIFQRKSQQEKAKERRHLFRTQWRKSVGMISDITYDSKGCSGKPVNIVPKPPSIITRTYSHHGPLILGENPMEIGTCSTTEEREKCNSTLHHKLVKERLSLFRAKHNELIRLKRNVLTSSEKPKKASNRLELQAWKFIKHEYRLENPSKMLGHVPGVEIGDEFFYRVELMIVGMHSLPRNGIDYMDHHGTTVATCVVTLEDYIKEEHSDKMKNCDVLKYIGEGGHSTASDYFFPDQKVKKGNLTLMNSIHKKTPVRVVKGVKISHSIHNNSCPSSMKYVYDGLYTVTKYEKKKTTKGYTVYEFELRRVLEKNIKQLK